MKLRETVDLPNPRTPEQLRTLMRSLQAVDGVFTDGKTVRVNAAGQLYVPISALVDTAALDALSFSEPPTQVEITALRDAISAALKG